MGFLTFIDDYGVDIRRTPNQTIDQLALLSTMQYFYFKMYTEVYLSPLSMAYERHLQKAVELAIQSEIITADEIADLGDDTLLYKINNGSPNQVKGHAAQEARDLLQSLTSRRPFVSVAAFKYAGLKKEHVENQEVIEIKREYKENFVKAFKNPLRLTELETAISEDLKGIPVLCCLLPDPEKIKPTDVPLYDAGKKVTTLRTEDEVHYKSLEKMADEHFAIRLRVPLSESELVRKNLDKLVTSFYEHSEKLINREKKINETKK